ncbi:hypothetical protein QQF64_012025, partial [Cirrhinus molitorella]
DIGIFLCYVRPLYLHWPCPHFHPWCYCLWLLYFWPWPQRCCFRWWRGWLCWLCCCPCLRCCRSSWRRAVEVRVRFQGLQLGHGIVMIRRCMF